MTDLSRVTRHMIAPDPKTVEHFLHDTEAHNNVPNHGFDFEPLPTDLPIDGWSNDAANRRYVQGVSPRIIPLRKPGVSAWSLGVGCLAIGFVLGLALLPVLSAFAKLFR